MPIRRHGRTFEARIQHNGRRYSRSFASYRDAQSWETRLKQQIEDQRVGRLPGRTLEEAVTRWLTGEASVLKSAENLKGKVRVMLPYIEGRGLEEIADAAEDLKAAGIKQGLNPATINRRLAIFRRVARLAQRQWDWLDRDLAAKIRLLPGEKSRHVYLTGTQLRKLMTASTGKVREAIRWAVLTGLRRGELLGLSKDNLKTGAIVLADSKSGRPRVVPLPPELDVKRFPHGLTEGALVKGFRRARKRAGLDVRFHDLRHTYASWLAQGGSTLVQIRDLLGHSNLSVTSRYAHLARKDLETAVAGISTGTRRVRGLKKKAA